MCNFPANLSIDDFLKVEYHRTNVEYHQILTCLVFTSCFVFLYFIFCCLMSHLSWVSETVLCWQDLKKDINYLLLGS